MTEYINREQALYELCNNSIPVFAEDGHQSFVGDYLSVLLGIPAADVVEVVRCKDCYYWTKVDDEPKGVCVCHKRTNLQAVLMDLAPQTEENDYCSWGEREEVQG